MPIYSCRQFKILLRGGFFFSYAELTHRRFMIPSVTELKLNSFFRKDPFNAVRALSRTWFWSLSFDQRPLAGDTEAVVTLSKYSSGLTAEPTSGTSTETLLVPRSLIPVIVRKGSLKASRLFSVRTSPKSCVEKKMDNRHA